jgi:hypothetical protein
VEERVGAYAFHPRDGLVAGEPAVAELLDPAAFPALFVLEPAGEAAAAGRRALRLAARPRPVREEATLLLPRLGLREAESLVLDVDAELGFVLRCEARHRGRPFHVAELLSVDAVAA